MDHFPLEAIARGYDPINLAMELFLDASSPQRSGCESRWLLVAATVKLGNMIGRLDIVCVRKWKCAFGFAAAVVAIAWGDIFRRSGKIFQTNISTEEPWTKETLCVLRCTFVLYVAYETRFNNNSFSLFYPSQACIDDNLDMVEFLVQNRADVNRKDNEGWTPLHATSSCGYSHSSNIAKKGPLTHSMFSSLFPDFSV